MAYMKCEQCPYVQTLDANVAECRERLAQSEELGVHLFVNQVEDLLLRKSISEMPVSKERDEAAEAMERAKMLSYEAQQILDSQTGLAYSVFDRLDELRQLAIGQCVDGPITIKNLFGQKKIICTSQSSCVKKPFKL